MMDKMMTNKINYTIGDYISSGAFSKVYKCYDDKKNIYAIKVSTYNKGLSYDTINELSHISQLKHNNIISTEKLSIVDNNVYIIMPYYKNTLKSWLDKCISINDNDIKNIMYQLILGLNYMHENGYIHRDLKPQNILLDESNGITVKIADFNSTRYVGVYPNKLDNNTQTLWYRAPEVLMGLRYDYLIDIWSLGCIFAHMLNKREVFTGKDEHDQLNEYFKIFGTPLESVWPNKPFNNHPIFPSKSIKHLINRKISKDEKALLTKMLSFNPKKRYSCIQLLQLKYFDSLYKITEGVSIENYYEKYTEVNIYKKEKILVAHLYCFKHLTLELLNNTIDFIVYNVLCVNDSKIDTLFVGLNLFNKYMYHLFMNNVFDIDFTKIKLILVVCLNTADKLFGIYDCKWGIYINLIILLKITYCVEDLYIIQKNILRITKYDLDDPNVITFIRTYRKVSNVDIKKLKKLSLISLLNYVIFKHKPSIIAASLLYIIENKLINYPYIAIKECVKNLYNNIEYTQKNKDIKYIPYIFK